MTHGPRSPRKRSRLSLTQRIQLYRWLLRTSRGFALGRNTLSGMSRKEHDRQDMYFFTIWDAACSYYETYELLPDYEDVCGAIESRTGKALFEEDRDALNGLLGDIYGQPVEEAKESVYRSYLRQFLEELEWDQVVSSLEEDEAYGDLPEMLREVSRRVSMFSSVESETVGEPFPEEECALLERGLQKWTTGLAPLDEFLAGGQVDREVYGFCGPTGSCKTLVGLQLAVEAATYVQVTSSSEKHRRVYYVTWEGPIDLLKLRCLSYAARVQLRSLESAGWRRTLSRSSTLKDYERELFSEELRNGMPVFGEWERVQAARRRLNRNLRILDFTGEGSLAVYATQMCRGVRTAIELDQESAQSPGVALIVLDYAGLAVRRFMRHRSVKPEHMRHYLGGWGEQVKEELAHAFGCPVWSLHQLSTEAASRSPGCAPKLTDTAEARNYVENMDFGIFVGVPTSNNLCVAAMVKQRRTGRMREKIWQIDGELNRIIDVSRQWMRTASNQIVERSDAAFVIVQEPQSAPAAPGVLDRRSVASLFGSGGRNGSQGR